MEPTHVVIPIELYKQLGQFLTSLPYSQVVNVISTVEQHVQAVQHKDANEQYAERYLPVSGDSEDE